MAPSRHYLHIAADSERATRISDEEVAALPQSGAETNALFGAHHYRDYHFLYTLSDHVAHFGLEHHESSDDRIEEEALDRRRYAPRRRRPAASRIRPLLERQIPSSRPASPRPITASR